MLHLFAALGQFERDLIQARIRAGLAAAARGRTGGRKPAVTDDKLRRAREHIAEGLTVREAATRVKVGKAAKWPLVTGVLARVYLRQERAAGATTLWQFGLAAASVRRFTVAP